MALLELSFAVSCSRKTSPRLAGEIGSTGWESSTSPGPDSAIDSESPSLPGRSARRGVEEAGDELGRARSENYWLKEENYWLRTEIIRLQQSLADANQTIYSLNRKLDAIFKPNSVGE